MSFVLLCSLLIVSLTASSNCSNTYIATTGNATLPQKNDRMAVGYNDKTKAVVIIGGVMKPQQFVKFMVDTETFVDYNATYSAIDIEGSATYYTQVNDTLWMLSKSGDKFVTFNIETESIQQTAIEIPSTLTYGAACLTSYKQYLFIVGGDRWIHTIQIYNISSGEWLENVPLLKVGRRSPSCIVVNSVLYSIGGVDGEGNALDTIETLYFNGADAVLPVTSGNILDQTLNQASRGARAIQHGSDILVIGGTDEVEDISDITVIDTQTQTVAICGSLSIAAEYVAPVIAENVLYIFGGYNPKLPFGEWELDSYQKIVLPQLTTTAKPITINTTAQSPTTKPNTSAPHTLMPSTTSTDEAPKSTTILISSTAGVTSATSTTKVATTTPSAVIRTSDEAGKSGTNDVFTKKRVMIAIIAGSVILVIILLVVFLICRNKQKAMDIGAYDGLLKDSYEKDQVAKDAYHML